MNGRYELTDEPFVDTRTDPKRSRQLRAHWLRQAASAVESGTEGLFGFNLFSVAEADLEQARALHARCTPATTEK